MEMLQTFTVTFYEIVSLEIRLGIVRLLQDAGVTGDT